MALSCISKCHLYNYNLSLYIYITLYAIACHSHTSRKIRVYTARLKVIKRCACFKNSEVGPASVQTWLAYFVRSSRHDPMAHQ